MTWWPEDLPQYPLRDGFQRKPQPSVIAFGTEVGPGKTRRRSTSRVKLYAVRFLMTTAELDLFELFFEEDLSEGATPFEWNDPVTGTHARWRFSPTDPYTESEAGPDLWAVSVNLMRLS